MEKISINIWDDYCDDGYVPEGKTQDTYAYIESDLPHEDCKNVLISLQKQIESLSEFDPSIILKLNFYDSSIKYPSLIGTEHERFLFKRWQLEFTNLPHFKREQIVNALADWAFSYQGNDISVYSES